MKKNLRLIDIEIADKSPENITLFKARVKKVVRDSVESFVKLFKVPLEAD